MANTKRIALVTIGLANLMMALAIGPLQAILPVVATHFHVDITTASWVMTGFLLALTSTLLISGRLGDIYGHRQVFLAGAVLFTIVGTASGFVQDIRLLIALRVLQGVAAAAMAGNSLAIITYVFSTWDRGKAIGVSAMGWAIGGIIGITASTVLAQYLNWQWLFFLSLPLGLASIKCALNLRIDSRAKGSPKVDVLGATLLALVLVALSLSLIHVDGGYGGFVEEWYHHVALLVVAGLALIAFIRVENRAPQPMVKVEYLRRPVFSLEVVANGIMHMTMMQSVFLMPFLLQMGLGFTPTLTAVVLVSTQISNVVAAPLGGAIYDRTRWKILCPAAMVSIAGGLALLGYFGPTMPYSGLVGTSLVLGVGLGFFQTPNNTIVMGSVSPDLRGFAAGMIETSRQLGHTLGVGISSTVMAAALAGLAPQAQNAAAYVAGYQNSMLVSASIAALGILAASVQFFSREEKEERVLRLAKQG